MKLKSIIGPVHIGSLLALVGAILAPISADDSGQPTDLFLGLKPDPQKGLELLLNEPMATTVMEESDIDNLWQVWEPEEKAKAEKATPTERRKMTFERYGWATRPGLDYDALPLDYTSDGHGSLVTNCFSCHGGKVAGKTIPGSSNTHVDLTAIATDVLRLRAFNKGGDPTRIKEVVAPFKTPLNYHRGVTNAVIFAPMFAALRDPQLFKEYTLNPGRLKHHNMNAPAWWIFKKKEKIYCDAFAPKTPRQLMPFAMSPTFTYEKFQSFEPNFVHIYAYIDSLEAPKYPYSVDKKLAAEGEILFEQTCARCHGTYGEDGEFPQKVISIDEVNTDRVRLTAVEPERRKSSNESWLQYDGEHLLVMESEGYLAQPLDGIWASAPYFHNGAVPTLWDVMNSEERPVVWRRSENGYDENKIGLEVEAFASVPEIENTRLRRQYFDTNHVGNSRGGHTFPDEELNQEEKGAVLEYLKTL